MFKQLLDIFCDECKKNPLDFAAKENMHLLGVKILSCFLSAKHLSQLQIAVNHRKAFPK